MKLGEFFEDDSEPELFPIKIEAQNIKFSINVSYIIMIFFLIKPKFCLQIYFCVSKVFTCS